MKKLKIAVIFGGCSSEHGVSLQSAYSVIKYMDQENYDLIMIGITMAGEWFRFTGDIEKITKDIWYNREDCVRAILSPSREVHGILEFHQDGVREIRVDAVMPVLHGKNGEDGTIQGLIELAGIPVVGCGTLSSALCMDKALSHTVVRAAGIRTPEHITIQMPMDLGEIGKLMEQFSYPLYIKPARAGSSFGITCIQQQTELKKAIEIAWKYDEKIIIEEHIDGFEVGCAILGTKEKELMVGQVDEIELSGGFFDFTEKYTLKSSAIHMPARITAQKAAEIKNCAIKIYQILGCRVFARVDLFLTPNGEIVFNEVNTIPGFTDHSRYPNMLKGIGLSFPKIIDRLIEESVNL